MASVPDNDVGVDKRSDVDSVTGVVTSVTSEGKDSDEKSNEEQEEKSLSNEESQAGSGSEEMEQLEDPPPGSCTTCAFNTLVVINVALANTGFLLLVIGLVLKFGTDYINYLENLISDLYSKMSRHERRKLDIDIEYVLTAFVNGLIVVGFGLLFLTLVGFSGSLGKIRPALVVYCAMIVLLILAEMVLLIMFSDMMESFVHDTMYSTLKNKYKGNNGTETTSLAWNYIMITFQCCGVMNHTDFNEAVHWEKKIPVYNKVFAINLPYPVPPKTVVLVIPEPCCKVVDKRNITCALLPTDEDTNMNQGCLEPVLKYASHFYIYVDAVFLVIMLLQIMLLVLAVILMMAP